MNTIRQQVILLSLLVLSIGFYDTQAQVLNGADACIKGKILKRELKAASAPFLRIQSTVDTHIDVKYYKLDLDISYTFVVDTPYYSAQQIRGLTTIKAGVTAATLQHTLINFKNAGLWVDSVLVDATKQSFVHESDLIDINLGKSLSKGALFNLDIYYHGVPLSTGFGSFNFDKHGQPAQPIIWSLSQPFGAADWFPCKNDPADKADSSDVWITAPSDMISVSNGILEEVIDHASTKTYKWKSRYPIAQYLISVAISNYDLYQQLFKDSLNGIDMPVSHYVLPESNTAENKILIDETTKMLQFFSTIYGTYPFIKEKYAHAQHTKEGSGMEHQTCSTVGDFGTGLVAHELAHQWFGDKITCESWEHTWLHEGFASYSEALYVQHTRGNNEYKYVMWLVMTEAKKAIGSVYVEDPSSPTEIFNPERTYLKGATILHMLRQIVGDAKFFQILKSYITSEHSYGNANTEDFQEIAETVSGQDLNYFFQQWVYGHNYPKYDFGWATHESANSKGQFPTYIRISQKANTAMPEFFTMPIKLRIIYADNSILDTTVITAENQELVLYSPIKPSNVLFDPEEALLKDVNNVIIEIPDSLIGIADEILPSKGISHLKIHPKDNVNEFIVGFGLSRPQSITVLLYGTDGRLLKNIVESTAFGPGTYEIPFHCKNMSSGIYMLSIATTEGTRSVKFILKTP